MSPARPPVPRRAPAQGPGSPPAAAPARARPTVPSRPRPSAERRAASAPSPETPGARGTRDRPAERVKGALDAPVRPPFIVPRRPPVLAQGSQARFAERARAHRVRTWRRAAAWAGGAGAFGLLAWVLLGSPVLALDPEQVVVTGAGTVVRTGDVDAVVDEVAGVPLPRIDTIGLRSAVLDVPGVREARVTRAWPRGLSIALVAREPVAAVPDGERVQLLDVEGVAVGRAKKAPEGLPLVDVPLGDARTLAAVLGVLEALPPELAADVRSVAAQTRDTVTMVLRDGARVDWGSADETELKAAVLQALRTAKKSREATWFDVSAPTLPVTKG